MVIVRCLWSYSQGLKNIKVISIEIKWPNFSFAYVLRLKSFNDLWPWNPMNEIFRQDQLTCDMCRNPNSGEKWLHER